MTEELLSTPRRLWGGTGGANPEGPHLWGEPEPDIVDLSVLDADGSERLLASLDGRYVSTEVAGLFTGRVVGVKALSGSVELSRFVYTQG